jgi:hypothetical protein
MRPIHAQGYYSVYLLEREWRIWEVVNYYYYDESAKLAELVHKPFEYRKEILMTWESMQRELNKEKVRINGERVRVLVRNTSLEFVSFAEIPYFTFILEFKGPYKEGLNCFENEFEGGEAEYDYEAFWLLPPGWRFEVAETSCEYDVSDDEGRILMLWCRKGDKIKGYEKICWVPS